MKLPRQTFLRIAGGAAALPVLPRMAWSLDYPARPVRLIVGFPAGSGPDVIARLVGQRLWDRLGQQFIVENRSGAGSSMAAQDVVAAPADGYALLLAARMVTGVFAGRRCSRRVSPPRFSCACWPGCPGCGPGCCPSGSTAALSSAPRRF